MADSRKYPLEAAANREYGVLYISIGLDTLKDLRKRLGVNDERISAADIAEHLADAGSDGGHSPFEAMIVGAVARAKAYDDEREETTEPSTEFFR